jgi:hypothetical protein
MISLTVPRKNNQLLHAILAFFLLLVDFQISANPGTAFTYQGRLADGTTPIETAVDLRFNLYDAETSGTQVGSSLEFLNAAYDGGIVQLDLDFGAGAFNGDPRWLEIKLANPAGNAYTTLTPRIQILPTPYSMYADTAGSVEGGVDDADADPTNELQDLSFSDGRLTLTDDTTVNISALSSADGDVNALYADNEGNVGIGTETPTGKLDVSGHLVISSNQFSSTFIMPRSGASRSGIRSRPWQSFTAIGNGYLTSVALPGIARLERGSGDCFGGEREEGDIIIYEGEGRSGAVLLNERYSYDECAFFQFTDIPIDITDVPVVGGNVYTVYFNNSSMSLLLTTGDAYPDGRSDINPSQDYLINLAYDLIEGDLTFPDGTVQTTAFTGIDNVDDADADPANELQDIAAVLSEGGDAGGANISNLGSIMASSFSGDGSGLTGIDTDDADADPTNEIQNIAEVLSEGSDAGGEDITNLGSVTASSFSGDGSGLTGIDTDSTNEFQNLSFSGGQLTLTDDTTVNVNALADGSGNTDALIVNNTGNVGIGTPNPFERLEVIGGLRLADLFADQVNYTGASRVNATRYWQSFTPSVSGDLAAMEFRIASNKSGTYRLYLGEGNGGDLLTTGSFVTIDGTFQKRIVLENPQEVVAETIYTFEIVFNSSAELFARPGNPYPRGRSQFNGSWDYNFATYMLGSDSSLIFPDGTSQTTAFTGIDNVDDADADPVNELQDIAEVLTEGNDAGGANIANLGSVTASSFSGSGSGLTGININDADANPSNEIQNIAEVLADGNNAGGASITNLGSVSAAIFSGDGSGLTGINVNDGDSNSSNELQNIAQVLSRGNNAGGNSITNLGTVFASEVDFGSSRQYNPVGSTTAAATVAGRVNSDGSAVTNVTNLGFSSSRTAAGQYSVTFTTAFADEPIITATVLGNDPRFTAIESVSTSGFTIRIRARDGSNESTAFNFIAIGER